MPIIVRHIPTQNRYILLGPAYGMATTNRTNLSWDTGYASFESKLLVVANVNGEIIWLPAAELSVESVAGKTCRDVLIETTDKEIAG